MPEWIQQIEDPRRQSNAARYHLLWTHGGLYLDHDVIPLVDLRRVSREPWTAAIDRREGCVMFFPRPKHPMTAALVEAAQAAGPDEPIGAPLLHEVGSAYDDVGREKRVIPFGSDGQATLRPGEQALAVHLWHTSRGD